MGLLIPAKIATHRHAFIDCASLEKMLEELGLSKYKPEFNRHDIDLDALQILGPDGLKTIGLPLGPVTKITNAMGWTKPVTVGSKPNAVQDVLVNGFSQNKQYTAHSTNTSAVFGGAPSAI